MRPLNTAVFFMEFKQSELKNQHTEHTAHNLEMFEGAAVYVCQSVVFIGIKKKSNEGFH